MTDQGGLSVALYARTSAADLGGETVEQLLAGLAARAAGGAESTIEPAPGRSPQGAASPEGRPAREST